MFCGRVDGTGLTPDNSSSTTNILTLNSQQLISIASKMSHVKGCTRNVIKKLLKLSKTFLFLNQDEKKVISFQHSTLEMIISNGSKEQ